MKRTLKHIFSHSLVGVVAAIEVSHSAHALAEGNNNPSHGRRNEENRTALELDLQRIRNRGANGRASGDLHAEFHDEVITHDQMCLCQRHPQFVFPKNFCLTV